MANYHRNPKMKKLIVSILKNCLNSWATCQGRSQTMSRTIAKEICTQQNNHDENQYRSRKSKQMKIRIDLQHRYLERPMTTMPPDTYMWLSSPTMSVMAKKFCAQQKNHDKPVAKWELITLTHIPIWIARKEINRKSDSLVCSWPASRSMISTQHFAKYFNT